MQNEEHMRHSGPGSVYEPAARITHVYIVEGKADTPTFNGIIAHSEPGHNKKDGEGSQFSSKKPARAGYDNFPARHGRL